MRHAIALAAVGLTAAMITAGLTAPAPATTPLAGAPGPDCLWVPPLPTATVTDPQGQQLTPCSP